jgi:hypothetical protein
VESKKKTFIQTAHTLDGEKIEVIADSLGIKPETLKRYISTYGYGRLTILDGNLKVHEDWGELRTFHNDDSVLELIKSQDAYLEREDSKIIRIINQDEVIGCERLG